MSVEKRLIIEEIKRFSELYKSNEGIGEQGLDELANKILSFSKDYISKDKIREKIKDYTDKSKHPLVNSQSKKEYTFVLKALKGLLEEK